MNTPHAFPSPNKRIKKLKMVEYLTGNDLDDRYLLDTPPFLASISC